jgi:hypothetical protein
MQDIYGLLFAGAGTSLLGALAGAWIGARLNYGFQKKLLDQQLAFQKEQARLDSEQRKALSEELLKVLSYLRDTVNYRLGKLASDFSDGKKQ